MGYLNSNKDSIYDIQRIEDEVTYAQVDVLNAELDVLNVEENLYKSQVLVLNKEYEGNYIIFLMVIIFFLLLII